MITTTEAIATTLIWALTACGLFFGIRGALKRHRRNRNTPPENHPPKPADQDQHST